MVGNRRFSNVSDMTSYMHDWSYCQEEILDRKAQIEETMFLGLRCTAGVSDRMFSEKFGQSMMDIYGDIIRIYIRRFSCLSSIRGQTGFFGGRNRCQQLDFVGFSSINK